MQMFVEMFLVLTLKSPHLNLWTNQVYINENVEKQIS